MFKQRALAMFLAFTFIIGFIPNVGLENVFASAPALIMDTSGHLEQGINNDTPWNDTATPQPTKSFMFNWNAGQLTENESSTLSYWVKPSYRMNVTTKRNLEDITVDIWLDNGTTPIAVPDTLELIYNSQAGQYLTGDKFFDALGNDYPAYNSYPDKSVEKTGTDKVSFTLGITDANVGYSVKYNGYDLHFLLDTEGNFYFYQNENFSEGLVYYPTLTHTDSIGNVTKKEERAFSIGLDLEKTVSTPFVDHAPNTEYESYKYDIEARQSTSIVDGDEVGFSYSIELPYTYDVATNTFTQPVQQPAKLDFNFKNKGQTYISGTAEFDAKSNTVTASNATFKQGQGSLTSCTLSGNVLTLTFKGLDSGLLLSPEFIYGFEYPAPEIAIVKDDLKASENLAYTFPEYTIINRDGTDYVEITPFAGYLGEYVLYSVPSKNPGVEGDNLVDTTNIRYAASYYKDSAASTDKVLLPLAAYNGEEEYMDYKIFFNPNGRFPNPGGLYQNMNTLYPKYIKTRYFTYNVKERGTVGFPNDFEVKDVNQSKMFVHDGSYASAGSGYYVENFKDTSYTLAWDLGKMTSIDKMLDGGKATITYNINIGEAVDVVDKQFLEIDFNLDGTNGTATLDAANPFDATFNITSGTVPKSPLNDVIEARITTVYSPQASAYVYRLEIDLENVAIDANEKGNQPLVAQNLFFEYPNIYFFTVNPEKVDFDDATKVDLEFGTSIKSSIKSLTLNKDTSVELKEPIKVKTDNMVTEFIGQVDALGQTVTQDQVSLDFTYEQQQATLAEYMNYYFTNYDLNNYGQNMIFTNDIYISQDYDMMSKTIPNLTKDERNKASTEFKFVENKNDDDNYVVMMRDFKNNTSDPTPLTSNDGSQVGADVLRKGGVVRISGVPLETNARTSGAAAYVLPSSNIVNTVQINGLDTNAKYYFYVDTSVTYDKDGNHRHINSNRVDSNILDPKSSDISALASGTTGSQMQQPSILDEVPLMPDVSLLETGRNNFKITWEQIDMTIADTTRYEQEFQYEVLRIRDSKLPDQYLDARQDLKEVFKNQIDTAITDKSAQLLFRNSSGQPDVLLYDPKTNTFIEPEDGLFIQQYDDDNNIIYDDNSLSANKVYFVYVRTVRVITDTETNKEYKVYSPWDVLSATTVLGDPPIDLKVVYNYSGTYDPQTEIPLSFRAKVPTLSDIGKDFTFEVTYQYDGKEWVKPITINSSTLQNSASAIDAEGYRTFTFILSDLLPGKSYNIKVRQANSDGSYTQYSNTVQWKTEIDEDEYDKDDEVGAFEDLMDDRVDSLIDGSQVILEDEGETIIMINGNNLANEITNSTANTIVIDSIVKGQDNTILIPFEAYEKANKEGMAWQFKYEDMFFNWSAKTIDQTYNANVIAMNKKIERDVIEDYYMQIVLDYQGKPNLNGDTALTDVVKISTKLVATTENVLDFQEAELKATLEEVKNSDRALAKKQAVLDKIRAGMYAEDALKLVDEYVEYVQDELQKSLQSKLKAIGQTRDDQQVAKLDKNFVMGTSYQNVLSKVTAYSVNNGVAVALPTTRTTNMTTAMVKDFGTYGFGGNVVNITGTIPNQNGNNNVSNIIAVNDLEDTMSDVGSTVDTSATMSVSQAITAMSNMTGMTETEVKSLLNSKGVNINRNNESKDLTQDLGVAMVAVLYEQINGIDPNAVSIKDYTFYNKLTSSSIPSGYVKHIQLAKEVGIISSVPSTTTKTTVGEFLGMLSKI